MYATLENLRHIDTRFLNSLAYFHSCVNEVLESLTGNRLDQNFHPDYVYIFIYTLHSFYNKCYNFLILHTSVVWPRQ